MTPRKPLPGLAQNGWNPRTTPIYAQSPVIGSGPSARSDSEGTDAILDTAVIFQKTIDNSRVRYRSDPGDPKRLRMIASVGFFMLFVLVTVFGPRLWLRHAGYRQVRLAENVEQLVQVRDQLKIRRGSLRDLRRVAALAEIAGLVETTEERYVWSAPATADDRRTVAQLFAEGSN